MACSGITVISGLYVQASLANYQMVADAQTAQIIELLRPHTIKLVESSYGTVAIVAALPTPTGQKLPVRIALERKNGKLTAITDGGTYEDGVKTLTAWVASMASRGISISGVKFESHRHGNQPKLAYTEPIHAH